MNVPAPYKLLTVVRSRSKSSMKKSMNSDTEKLWPGELAIMPTIATNQTIQP